MTSLNANMVKLVVDTSDMPDKGDVGLNANMVKLVVHHVIEEGDCNDCVSTRTWSSW